MSNKNLICLIITFGIALLTIGSAFCCGHIFLGSITLFIWAILYLIYPSAIIYYHKANCSVAEYDIKYIVQKSLDNYYISISFVLALLLAILFDDYITYFGSFLPDYPQFDMFLIPLIVATSASVSVSFYYLFTKRDIEKIKRYGERVEVSVEYIKKIRGVMYVSGWAINPINGQNTRVVGITYADDKAEVPQWLNVYFDRINVGDYYMDACSWIIE